MKEIEIIEQSFANTMAGRDFTAFKRFIDEEAVFFSDSGILRGKEQICRAWKNYFTDPEAPFSWEPERVAVLASGELAMTTGPVSDRRGAVIAAFTSIWRRDEGGEWKIIFDKGGPAPAPETGE